jgi:hypothetical protein
MEHSRSLSRFALRPRGDHFAMCGHTFEQRASHREVIDGRGLRLQRAVCYLQNGICTGILALSPAEIAALASQ